jgi:hypothetical protein
VRGEACAVGQVHGTLCARYPAHSGLHVIADRTPPPTPAAHPSRCHTQLCATAPPLAQEVLLQVLQEGAHCACCARWWSDCACKHSCCAAHCPPRTHPPATTITTPQPRSATTMMTTTTTRSTTRSTTRRWAHALGARLAAAGCLARARARARAAARPCSLPTTPHHPL